MAPRLSNSVAIYSSPFYIDLSFTVEASSEVAQCDYLVYVF